MKRYLLVLYLIVFIVCEELSGDKGLCAEADGKKNSKDTCWNVKLQNAEDHCCFSYPESSEDEGFCDYIEAEDFETYSNPKSYAIYKENQGFYCYNSLVEGVNEENCEVDRNYKLIYECKEGKAIMTSEIHSYEDSEKEILRKESHCFTYFYKLMGKTLNFTETKKSDCTEASITKQAKDNGITCGFYEFVYKIKNKEEDFKINTCYLLDPDSIKNEEKAKKDLKEFALSLAEGTQVKETDIDTVDISVSDGSGNSFSYDTKSGTLTNNNKNNSQLISFSKLLFLLILISL
jgi:hypothetical protein